MKYLIALIKTVASIVLVCAGIGLCEWWAEFCDRLVGDSIWSMLLGSLPVALLFIVLFLSFLTRARGQSADNDLLAHALARQEVRSYLSSEMTPATVEGDTWYRIESLNPHHEGNYLRLCYAENCRMLHHHPTQPNLVQIVEVPE
jgi:uncharacterized membrane protein